MACSPWMLKSVWPVDRLNRSVLQKGSKGPLPQGACNSQSLAQESMDQAAHASRCEDLQCD